VVKPHPGPAADGGSQGSGARCGVAPVDVDAERLGNVGVAQPELLALVQEGRPPQREQQHGRHPRALLAAPVVVVAAGHARMVVVVQTPGRPHLRLGQRAELVDDRAEALGAPRLQQQVEVVDHVQLVARVDVLHEPGLVGVDLADGDALAVVALEHGAQPAQALVDGGPVLAVRAAGLVVAQRGVLAELVGDVEPDAAGAAIQPEAQDVEHGPLHLRVVPVEVGLLGQERVQVPLRGALVPRPRRAGLLPRGQPIVGRHAVAPPVTPDVPVAPRRAAARARLREPRVAVGGVVGHPVDDHAQAARARLGDELVEVGERAEARVDVGVVGDVVAEVGHRRGVERRQPDAPDAKGRRGPGEVVEPSGDAAQVAHPVAVGVAEAAGVDLVDRIAAPPGERGMRHLPSLPRETVSGLAARLHRSGQTKTPRAAEGNSNPRRSGFSTVRALITDERAQRPLVRVAACGRAERRSTENATHSSGARRVTGGAPEFAAPLRWPTTDARTAERI
jgi:hypothetical protein